MVLTCFFLLALWALASVFAYFWVNLVISLSPLLVVTLSLQPKSRPTRVCTALYLFKLFSAFGVGFVNGLDGLGM